MRGWRLAVLTLMATQPWLATADDSGLDLLPIGDPARAFELASAEAGTFHDCGRARTVELEELADSLAAARVVLLGEEHTSLEQKLVQAKVVDELARRVPKLVLGMEFFERGDAEALAGWTSGKLDGDAFLRAVAWYDRGSYRFGYYRPVMEAARRHGLRVVGLNLPREIPRAVSRGGLAALSEQQRREVGEVTTEGSPQHRYLVSRYFGETVAQMPPSWLDTMYAAQCVWDTAMARSILANLGEGETMVVVVGSGHVAYDLGIARRIHEQLRADGRPDLPVATYCPVTAPAPEPALKMGGHPVAEGADSPEQGRALFVRSLADFVGVFADTGGVEAYPTLGIKLEAEADGSPRIAMVWPDSVAERAGLQTGDNVLDLNGSSPADLVELRLVLARSEWGQRLDLRVRRGEEQRDVALLLEPEVRTVETTVAPGFKVEPAGALVPDSREPAAAVAARVEEPRRLLVSHRGRAQRVEVWSGDVLDEVHELDEAGRVARSVYRHPLPDQAVELRYQRDADGAVSAVSRLDRAGRRVGE